MVAPSSLDCFVTGGVAGNSEKEAVFDGAGDVARRFGEGSPSVALGSGGACRC